MYILQQEVLSLFSPTYQSIQYFDTTVESMETYTIPENEAIDIFFHIYIRRNVRDIISVDLIDRNSGELIS